MRVLDTIVGREEGCRSDDYACVSGVAKRSPSMLTVAARLGVVCGSLLFYALTFPPRKGYGDGVAPIEASTFVWSTPAAAARQAPGEASSRQKQGHAARLHARRSPRFTAAQRRLAARGREAAATSGRSGGEKAERLGFDIARTLDTSYRRGEQGSEALIHIDLPIQQNPLGSKAASIEHSVVSAARRRHRLPPSLRLNKEEEATLKEEKTDQGGMLRLKAMGSRFAKRVEQVEESARKKMVNAAEWRRKHPSIHALSQIYAVKVPQIDQDRWREEMKEVDRTIAAHGGIPQSQRDASLRRALRDASMQQQLMYDQALRR